MRRLRALGLPAMGLLAAVLLLAPALALLTVTSRAVGDAVVARAAIERDETAAVLARLMELTLANAGKDLVTRGLPVKAALASGDTVALNVAVAELRAVSPLYTNVAAFDAAGTMLARDPDPGGVVGQSFAERDYYTGALSSTQPYVADAFTPRVEPFAPLVAVSYAVRDGGRTYGLLVVTITARALLRAFEPIPTVPGRDVVIVDRGGRVVTSSSDHHEALSLIGTHPEQRTAFVARALMLASGWTLYVTDPSDSVLSAKRELDGDLRTGASVTGLAALLLGFLFAIMYRKVTRQRDALAAAQLRLTAANADLAKADLAKSAFLADMSHELRTPMNAILGFTDLLKEQLAPTLTDRHRRFFWNIHTAGQHLLGLINDVLDLSKVQSGRIDLRPEVIDLAVLLEPVIVAARVDAERAGHTFSLERGEGGSLRLDVARTRQILFNLLSNAVKFTEAPGTIAVAAELEEGALVVRVSDSGIGIPPEAAARLFGLFERVNRDRSDAQGSGLGLALTKRLVELQGGEISVDSTLDRGSTFTVRLPGVHYAPSDSEAILIVEDEWADAELLEALATEAGTPSRRVSTLAHAMAELDRARPLGVVLDLFLPDGHGSSILEVLKSSTETADIPVLVVTSATDTARFRLMGAECLTKPIDPAQVRAWLRRVAPPLAA